MERSDLAFVELAAGAGMAVASWGSGGAPAAGFALKICDGYGGLPNTVVELVNHNREVLTALSSEVSTMETQLRGVVGRANEIEISFTGNAQYPSHNGAFGYRVCPDFTLKIFEYSGIGTGINVYCHPSLRTCTFDTGEDGYRQAVAEDEYDTPIDDDEYSGDLVVTPHNADEIGRRIGVDLGSDIDESDGEEYRRETVEMNATEGPNADVTKRKTDNASIPTGCQKERCRVLRRALEMRRAGTLFVQQASGSYNSLSKATLDTFNISHEFPAGWAVRPQKGSMYGAKYIGPFRAEIQELFCRGKVSSAERKGPGGMLEVLRLRYPDRFDLPSENEIRQEITKSKRQCTQHGEGQKARITKDQISFLEQLLSREPDTAPKVLVAEFRAVYKESELTDNQINYQAKKIKKEFD
ncbi:hypothetical protein PHYSODRAFT_299118 [Phytophthora sojae]|uniref:Uncharacterized protein n=1 Tax=Phytophthora sojae (strain P6497) TaxID=1094619 RepID=G4ZC87_PHYSP|nr:hypothetical protein PHYSODRAFT_299118 [Phytophthora sojae]EGZ21368.1 hypothetical protein PHYSODRAFT_299118 [Phytophthora sojae]|eukprot:XP_009524085.1 hypothetical protein PHYSODRAFT_299118 [Phytophthora sojae]